MFKRLLLLALLLQISCLADGFYKTANAMLPSITGQRAIIKHKDGVQTMIIESALESEAQELGWIVPLPSVPTEVKVMKQSVFHQFYRDNEIKIDDIKIGSLTFYMLLPYGFLGILPLICLLYSVVFRKSYKIIFFTILTLFTLFFTLVMIPGFAHFIEPPSAGTKAPAAEIVEGYQINIIQANHINELSSWNKNAGFSEFSKQEKNTINAYINKGWSFVCTKLKRKEAGNSAPPPLKLTFQSTNPVYPMTSPSLTNSSFYCDFFVISDSSVSHPQLRTLLSRQYIQRDKRKPMQPCDEFYYEQNGKELIGLTAFGVNDLFWNKMIITRLTAKLKPSQMNNLTFNKTAYTPINTELYSDSLARPISVSLNAGFVMILITIFLIKYEKKERALLKFANRAMVTTAVVCIFIFYISYLRIETVNKKEYQTDIDCGWRHMPNDFLYSTISEYGEDFIKNHWTPEKSHRDFEQYLKETKNGYTPIKDYCITYQKNGYSWLCFSNFNKHNIGYYSYLKLKE